MKRLMIGATVIALLTGPVAIAQPDNHRGQQQEGRGSYNDRNDNQQHDGGRWHDNGDRRDANNGHRDNGRHRGWGQDRGHHYGWNRGERMGYNDWNDSRRIDYRHYNLRQPPRGYEWRRNDDRFILADIGTGLIMSVILHNGR